MNKNNFDIRPATEDLAALVSLFTKSASFLAGVMALWSLTASLRITQSFAVSEGVLSSWIVWAALAAGLNLAAPYLTREIQERLRSMPVRVLPNRRTIAANDRTAAA
ncbi:MAG: hypothetical protein SFV18_13635 [Bryobacteraceae bacterium]|nr:hypothetical protein [Bryobacteraceae bacterium]